MKAAAFALLVVALATPALAQNSPPVGNQMPVQQAKTGNYTVKQTDLRTILPMNCGSPCTVTMPQSTSSFPKGYPVLIANVGTAAVTITATTSTIYGIPTSGGNITLSQCGDYAALTADQSNNYFGSGNLNMSGTCNAPATIFAFGVSSGNAFGVSSGNAYGQ